MGGIVIGIYLSALVVLVAIFDEHGEWLASRPAPVDERPLEPQPERVIIIDGRPVKFRRLPEGEADRLLVSNPVIYRDMNKTGDKTWKIKKVIG